MTLAARLLTLIGEEKPYAWAVRVGVPKPILHKALNQGSPISLKQADKICEATGCALEWLLRGVGEPFPQTSPATEETAPPANNVIGTIVAGTSQVNLEVLAMVESALEEVLQEKGLRLKPERRGAVIAFLYDYATKGGGKDGIGMALNSMVS